MGLRLNSFGRFDLGKTHGLIAAATATIIASWAPAVVAQTPRLARTAASAEAFAPAGWRVEQAVIGDISRDGVPDLVFVLRKTDPANIIQRDHFEPSDINPRILALALGDADGFTLAVQDDKIIPGRTADGLNMDDPFDEGLSIHNGSAVLTLQLFMSAGGADMGSFKFRLRHQDGAMRLIGYDLNMVQRMTGATTAISVNFLNRRMTVATGSIESDAETVRTLRTTTPALPLQVIGDAFAFDYEVLRPRAR